MEYVPIEVNFGFQTPCLDYHVPSGFLCNSRGNTVLYDLVTYSNRLRTCLMPTTSLMVTLLRRTLGRSRSSDVFELYRVPTLSSGFSVLLRLCAVICIVCRSLNGLVLEWCRVFPSHRPCNSDVLYKWNSRHSLRSKG